MSLLNILQWPDPRLKTLAEPIIDIDHTITAFIDDLFETMYAADGVGLAATQVNVHKRILAIDISHQHKQPCCLINPEIIYKSGHVKSQEGCLSFPGVYATVERSKEVEVRFLDRHGKQQQLKADGLLGICIQHEVDHLNGITFFDHLSSLKQQVLKNKLEKYRRRAL